jgi:alpha-beta hydrolase superfamily lysophospholipase
MMKPTKEMQYLNTTDHLQLYVTSWHVDAPRGAVLLVHGIGEHSGRYPQLVSALTRRGYDVYTYDQRGHGKSGGQRAYFDTPDVLPDDLTLVRESLDRELDGAPLFLYGHSMGALVVLAHALDHQDGLAGLVLTGAPIDFDSTVSPALATVAKLLNKITPRAAALDLVDPKALSHDPLVVKAYVSDPLNFHGRLSVRSGSNLLDLLQRTRSRLPELVVPLLLLHGAGDAICPPSGSQRIHDEASSADKTLTFYPDLYHEIHNEREQMQVLRDILDWLDQHTGPDEA